MRVRSGLSRREFPMSTLIGLIRDAFPDEFGRPDPPESDDPEGPNRPVRVPPPDPSGAGGGLLPDGAGAPGTAEPSERASPRAGRTAPRSRQDDPGLSAHHLGTGPQPRPANQDRLRIR